MPHTVTKQQPTESTKRAGLTVLLLISATTAFPFLIDYTVLPFLSGRAERIRSIYDNIAIDTGMTQDEVETLIGLPPGNHASGIRPPGCIRLEGFFGTYGRRELWRWKDSWIGVYFDTNGKVVGKELWRAVHLDPPLKGTP